MCRTHRAEWCAGASQARFRGLDVKPRRLLQRRHERTSLLRAASGMGIARAVNLDPCTCVQARRVFPDEWRNAAVLPAVDRRHQMPREGLDEALCADLAEPLVLERRGQRIKAGSAILDGGYADGGSEHQPIGNRVLLRLGGPAEPTTADQPAIDADRIR